jgi:hypothetical protein
MKAPEPNEPPAGHVQQRQDTGSVDRSKNSNSAWDDGPALPPCTLQLGLLYCHHA